MNRRHAAFLVLSAVLLGGWIAYLLYLALTTRHPVVLSRPQFLVSDTDVTAQVDSLDGPVTVVKVHHLANPTASLDPGKTIAVENLTECQVDWRGPGPYILPLVTIDPGHTYKVARIPQSPGYSGGSPRIYPAGGDAEKQILEIRKSAK
jgi:hypothetical protein